MINLSLHHFMALLRPLNIIILNASRFGQIMKQNLTRNLWSAFSGRFWAGLGTSKKIVLDQGSRS